MSPGCPEPRPSSFTAWDDAPAKIKEHHHPHDTSGTPTKSDRQTQICSIVELCLLSWLLPHSIYWQGWKRKPSCSAPHQIRTYCWLKVHLFICCFIEKKNAVLGIIRQQCCAQQRSSDYCASNYFNKCKDTDESCSSATSSFFNASN